MVLTPNREQKAAQKKLKYMMENLSNDKEIYATTESDIRVWFDIINAAIFRGKILRYFTSIIISRKRGVWAHYTGDRSNYDISRAINSNKKPTQELSNEHGIVSNLSISSKFPNIRGFINILAHEMVHHYQFECESPGFLPENISHGKSFWKWKDIFRKNGLNLQRVQKI